MKDDKPNAIDDIKSLKGYILGVAALAAGVTTFCTLTFHWEAPKVSAISASVAVIFIVLAFLIQRAENRNARRLETHIETSEKRISEFSEGIDYLKRMALENQRASTRIEMNSFIRNEPWNHDTILAYAEKYFLELDGDWKETDVFLSWVDKENEAGRKVHVPPELFSNVHTKSELEKGI